MNNQKNIVLCGVGGQGTVLASKLLAAAAMSKDIPVMSAETIGMAQRGGSVFSHLRMGDNLYSPMIETGTADLIIGFEPGETVRMLPYLKDHGHIVVSTRAVKPVTATLSGSDYDAPQMLEYLKADSCKCRSGMCRHWFFQSTEHGASWRSHTDRSTGLYNL